MSMSKGQDKTMITHLFDSWPERIAIPVRLHLYSNNKMQRCCLTKLNRVFELANEFGIQRNISTNLNRLNAVYVDLDNYVLTHKDCDAAVKGSWGNHYGFLLALAKEFPNDVFIDDPTGGTLNRYCIDASGAITETIETHDDC